MAGLFFYRPVCGMKVRDIIEILEAWAPRGIAWEQDNVGLQCGSPDATVRGILVCLDPTERVIAEARTKKANLVVSHHPLFFKPVTAVTTANGTGRCLEALIRNGIALYSAHTNLDFTEGGTSFALASTLGVKNPRFLHTPYQLQRKVVTFVPASHADRVATAMAMAGGGIIGKYDNCSFRTAGTGTFRGNEASLPVMGRKGVLEHAEEVRIEMPVMREHLQSVVCALKNTHPYEEVAYDVYPLENATSSFGMGVIGTLHHAVQLSRFLNAVKKSVGTRALRWTGDPRKIVRHIAVCGGSGSELLEEAIRQEAEVFVTADVKYHSFHQAAGRIALIDAGHYETEFPVLNAVVGKLKYELRRHGTSIRVLATETSTNPVSYV
jgi:dinuclear metal center YbgI/SA1388 family protein